MHIFFLAAHRLQNNSENEFIKTSIRKQSNAPVFEKQKKKRNLPNYPFLTHPFKEREKWFIHTISIF